jgi:hypothetical protein
MGHTEAGAGDTWGGRGGAIGTFRPLALALMVLFFSTLPSGSFFWLPPPPHLTKKINEMVTP